MTPPCAQCKNPLRVRVNLTSDELSAIHTDLRFDFGPFVVTPERANGLRAMLALADTDIEEHDSEVDRLSEQLMVVRRETKRLKTQRATLLSLLSHTRKLPNETLSRIFQHVCEEKENLLQCYPWMLDETSPPTRITSPVITYLPAMAISSVCSRWRALALSSPRLWTNLKVEIYTATILQANALTGFTDTVTRYLERSGDWPLRISLDIQGEHKAVFPSLIHLTQHAWHWKTFKYLGDHSFTNYRILSELHFPLLEELDIRRVYPSNDLDRFELCPKLRALSTPWPKGPIPGVLYSRLDHLNFTNRTLVADFIDTLRSCSHLTSFKIGNVSTFFLNTADLAQGRLGTWPNIVSLSMNGSSSDTVFSSFNFPSLNTLEVYGIGSTLRADTFISFVSRSSCIITTFTLQRTSISDMDLIAVLRAMPALLHLGVDQYERSENPIPAHLLLTLTHHQSASVSLVPKLHSLRLRYEPPNGFDDATFVSMVQSRWFKPGSDLSAKMLAMGRSSIRSVVLKFDARKVDADIYKPLQILEAEGLRVVVAGTNGIQV